jgi:DNA-binding LacI/PurR family transcriptional regulator
MSSTDVPASPGPKRGRGRPKRFNGIADRIVATIASGELVPGQRMLARRSMVEKYQATIVTVQKALAQLEEAGVVRSDGWQGTFVSEHPPCLTRFGILIPDLRDDDGRFPSLYFDSLATTAKEVGKVRECEWVVFDGLLASGKRLKTLRSDLAHHRLAGLATLFSRQMVPLIQELTSYNVPILQIGGPAPLPGCRHLDFDRATLAALVARRLVDAGSHAPLVAVLGNTDPSHLDVYRQALAQHRLELAPGAMMGFDHRHPGWLGEWLAGQWQRPAGQRPDGLLLLDDNFIGSAAQAMDRLGIVAGRDLPVVAYVNYPCDRLPAGCIGVGCDSRVVLRMASEELLRARRGQPASAEPIPMMSPDP